MKPGTRLAIIIGGVAVVLILVFCMIALLCYCCVKRNDIKGRHDILENERLEEDKRVIKLKIDELRDTLPKVFETTMSNLDIINEHNKKMIIYEPIKQLKDELRDVNKFLQNNMDNGYKIVVKSDLNDYIGVAIIKFKYIDNDPNFIMVGCFVKIKECKSSNINSVKQNIDEYLLNKANNEFNVDTYQI